MYGIYETDEDWVVFNNNFNDKLSSEILNFLSDYEGVTFGKKFNQPVDNLPNSITHIVFNNCAHDSVGGQPTVGGKIDIRSIALNTGYQWGKVVSKASEIKLALNEMANIDGPALLEIQVKKGFRENLGRPTTTPIQNKEAFMGFVIG